MSSQEFWEKPHYKYASSEALVHLDDKMVRWHNVTLVNVTLEERCLNTGGDDRHYSPIKARMAPFLKMLRYEYYHSQTIDVWDKGPG